MKLKKKTLSKAMILSLMIGVIPYTFSGSMPRKIETFPLTKDFTYTGNIQGGFFSGIGVLKTPLGVYRGTFEEGRFSGKGKFEAMKAWEYEGIFHPQGNSEEVKITLKNKKTYTKDGKKWTQKK